MLPTALRLLCLAAITTARAQTTTNTKTTRTQAASSSGLQIVLPGTTLHTLASFSLPAFTGSEYSYVSLSSEQAVTTSTTAANATLASSDSSISASTTPKLTVIAGQAPTSTSGGGRTSTMTAVRPSNTVPCNGYPEFCNRKYSNITNVCSHNSAFNIPNNAASNQVRSIPQQLDDGVRMLQGEVHYVNKTMYSCHTTCDLLNAGTFESELRTIGEWLRANPYDVVTFLIVNSDQKEAKYFVDPIQNSGVSEFLYEPAHVPQNRDQWPTLGEMIITGKRLVIFMDYKAQQHKIPYILNEFTHMWETPFSPTDRAFPCTLQRPPHLGEQKAMEDFMYLANHNLDVAIDLGALTGTSSSEAILIPNTAVINMTNGRYDTYGQLEAMTLNCTKQWIRPPNFLLVDYYNYGDPSPGSVFQVAARANGVTYNQQCCGTRANAASGLAVRRWCVAVAGVLAVAVVGWL